MEGLVYVIRMGVWNEKRFTSEGASSGGVCAVFEGYGYTAPQDQWLKENHRKWYVTSPLDVTIEEDRVFVTSGNMVRVFTLDGGFVLEFGATGSGNGQFSGPTCLDVHDHEVYVADRGNNRVQVLSTNGTYITKWPVSGSIYGITVDSQYVFVTCDGSDSVQCYTRDGTLVREWGSVGNLPGQFNNPQGIAVHGLYVFVADLTNKRVQVFTREGRFVRKWDLAIPELWGGPGHSGEMFQGPYGIAADEAGVCVSSGARIWGYGWYSRVQVYSKGGALLWEGVTQHVREQPSDSPSWGEPFSYPRGLAYRSPFIYVADNALNCVTRLREVFRTLGTATSLSNAIPRGEVLMLSQREGKSILDIDYVVADDRPNVTAYALAFKTGTPALDKVIPITSLVEGTAAHVGTNVTVGVTNRLTWNVSADWNVDYGDVQVAILAKDERKLLDLHFLHMPPVGTNTALTINQVPVLENDLLNLWFWVIASGDSRIRLQSGNVVGVGGAYDGLALTAGGVTTTKGREFLFAYAGVREATAAEVQRAKEGSTPGTVIQWTPRLTLPDGRPSKINAFGFDTGSTTGWWVVPLE